MLHRLSKLVQRDLDTDLSVARVAGRAIAGAGERGSIVHSRIACVSSHLGAAQSGALANRPFREHRAPLASRLLPRSPELADRLTIG
jgi:hypothetical protein